MIITEAQSDFLGNSFVSLLDLSATSCMPFPYGLPGWRCLSQMNAECCRLLRLNRLEKRRVRGRCDPAKMFFDLYDRIAFEEDFDIRMKELIVTLPVIYDHVSWPDSAGA